MSKSYRDINDKEECGDLSSCLEYNPQRGFTYHDIKGIHAQVPGEADGSDWHWILELKDGRIVLLVGGCDYTGWDCQSSAASSFHQTPTVAAESAKDEYDRKGISQQLLNQLAGKQPYGTYIST